MSAEQEFGIVVARDLMVPMRDGTRLATDIYRLTPHSTGRRTWPRSGPT